MVTVAPQQQPVMVHVQSFVGHIVFSCVVFWCCNWIFGLIAFILASQCTLLPLPTQGRMQDFEREGSSG